MNAAILKKVTEDTLLPICAFILEQDEPVLRNWTAPDQGCVSPGLSCVYSCVLKVIQWCTHHKDDPPPPEDDENKEKRTDDIPVWDQEFLKVDQGTLFELILVNTPWSPELWRFWSSLEFAAVPSLFIGTYF